MFYSVSERWSSGLREFVFFELVPPSPVGRFSGMRGCFVKDETWLIVAFFVPLSSPSSKTIGVFAAIESADTWLFRSKL